MDLSIPNCSYLEFARPILVLPWPKYPKELPICLCIHVVPHDLLCIKTKQNETNESQRVQDRKHLNVLLSLYIRLISPAAKHTI